MKKIIFILFILIILILGVFIFFPKEEVKETKPSSFANSSLCDQMQTPEMQLTCQGIFSEDPTLCSQAGNFDTYCYDVVFASIKKIDPKMCEEFEKYPRSACYLELAKKTKNPEFCNNVTFSEQCFWNLAKVTGDASLCGKMTVDCERFQCIAEVSNNKSYCSEVPDAPEKDTCIAMLEKDPTKCSEYGQDTVSRLIYASCLHTVASKTKDIHTCYTITYEKEEWSCIAELSRTMDICDKANDTFWKDFCRVEYIKNNIFAEKP